MSFATRGSYQGQAEDRCHAISEPQATWELGSNFTTNTLWVMCCCSTGACPLGSMRVGCATRYPLSSIMKHLYQDKDIPHSQEPMLYALESIYLASPNTNSIYLRSSINVHGQNEGRLAVRWQTHYSRGAGSPGIRFKVRELYLTLSSPIYFIRMWPPRLCKMGSMIFCKNM